MVVPRSLVFNWMAEAARFTPQLRVLDYTGLGRAKDLVHATPELLALELREALDGLGHVLGQISPDDLLGRIFSTFCIGK